MGRRLADALGRLEAEVLAAPAPAPGSYTQTAERDADNRIVRIVEVHGDGRVVHRVPVRDENQRIVSVTVTERPRA
jgi:hypothetical protein